MLEGAILVWFVLTGGSLLFLTWDLLTNSPVSWVQKLAWFLVVAYMGPVGLVVFLVACRRPFPGGHDAATKAIWKQGLNSEVHCLAGDAAGVSMIAGTIVIAGEPGIRYGPGMRRGSIVLLGTDSPDLLPTFRYSGTYQPTILRVLFRHLSQAGWAVPDGAAEALYHRHHGDFLELGKGEILLHAH